MARKTDEARSKVKAIFGENPSYVDVPGLCRVATTKDIEEKGWSLAVGRYVGAAPGADIEDEEFRNKLESLNEELDSLTGQAQELSTMILNRATELLEA